MGNSPARKPLPAPAVPAFDDGNHRSIVYQPAGEADRELIADQIEQLIGSRVSRYNAKQLHAYDRCLDLLKAAWPGDLWAQVDVLQTLQIRMRLAAKRGERGPLR